MDTPTLRRILQTFVDRPGDLTIGQGKILLQLRDELIEAQLFSRDGEVWIRQDDHEMSARTWIVDRVARVPLLARRILDLLPSNQHFVAPEGELVEDGRLDSAPAVATTAVELVRNWLARPEVGATNVLYLTSDAGEGKTTLINFLAREQAARFARREADWMLLPISLGGRTFLRLDDVIAGALSNSLRFPYWRFQGLVELVRLGVVVPALDGFEEMFVEGTAGEVVSALGGLLADLESAGVMLLAARRAYYDYRSLSTQARLFDSIKDSSVVFAHVELRRWREAQFVSYGELRGHPDAKRIYEEVSAKVEFDHPILTRAMLVSRLFDLLDAGMSRPELLSSLHSDQSLAFGAFVDVVLHREASSKWINKDGDPPSPLLTVDQHSRLLSLLASEMWVSGSERLRSDSIRVVGELFCQMEGLAPRVERQVLERLPEHALLRAETSPAAAVRFDHEEFYRYFLGRHICWILSNNHIGELRDVLRRAPLANFAVESAISSIPVGGVGRAELIRRVVGAVAAESTASIARENAGAVVCRLADQMKCESVSIERLVFPADALQGRAFEGLSFTDCYFHPTGTERSMFSRISFKGCTLERLEVSSGRHLDGVSFYDCVVRCVADASSEREYYDPRSAAWALVSRGAAWIANEPAAEPPLEVDPPSPDDDLVLAERALRVFFKNTHANESIFRTKLAGRFAYFSSHVVPRLQRAGILEEVNYAGRGVQRRFRLRVRFEVVRRAIQEASGDFERFLEIAQSSRTG